MPLKLEKAARVLQQILPAGYHAEVFPAVIDMPIDPDHIEIYKGNRLFHRTIARLIQDQESGMLELSFEDPIKPIVNAVNILNK